MNKIFSNSLFKEFSLFSSSTLIYQISRVGVELAAAKLLGPSLWGIWYLLNLAIAYSGISNLGITNGMNREVPITLGMKNNSKAKLLENITFSTVLISSIFISIIFVIISTIIEDPNLRLSFIALIPLFIITQFWNLISTSLKTNYRFNLVSKKQLIFAVIFPIISIPLTYFFGLVGFILGFTSSLIIPLFYIYKKSNINYCFNLNWKEIRNLIRIGFPIMAVGITYTFLNTADRWVIGFFLGSEELGFYSLAIIIFGVMTLLPKVISQQFYPRMAFEWGEKKSIKNLRMWASRQSRYTFYIVVPLLLLVNLVFPWGINNFLSEYKEGINSLMIISFGALFMPFSAGWGSILNIIDKQVYYLIIIVIAAACNIILNYTLIKLGYGIEGVAFATAFIFANYNVFIMLLGKYLLKNYKI